MIQAHFGQIASLIEEELDKATTDISVAMYFFTNKMLFEKLLLKANEGVHVNLIIYNNYMNLREGAITFERLANIENCYVYLSTKENPIHDKFCIIDNKALLTGSYNWTYAAEKYNKENILLVHNENSDEEKLIVQYSNEFDKLKNSLKPQKKFPTYSESEMDEYYALDGKEYLMQDLISEAALVPNSDTAKNLVKKAIELNPSNITIQKQAARFDLIPRKTLQHTIGIGLHNNKYGVFFRKGCILPIDIIETNITVTAVDNQTSSRACLYYGENEETDKNTPIKANINNPLELEGNNHACTIIKGFRALPQGEVSFRNICSIDWEGKLSFKTKILKHSYDKLQSIEHIEIDLTKIDGLINDIQEVTE